MNPADTSDMTDTDWLTDDTKALLGAILRLESFDDAADFFRDLCTRKELEDLGQRWSVVRLLDQGIAYREIAERTGASTATVTRINQWLTHGTGGYRRALDRENP